MDYLIGILIGLGLGFLIGILIVVWMVNEINKAPFQ